MNENPKMMQDQKPDQDPMMPEEDDFLDDFDETGFDDGDFADENFDDTASVGGSADAGDEDLGYLDEEFDDSYVDEDGWDADDDELSAPLEAGAGAQKVRKSGGLDLSFNTKVIIGAVIVGFCVLAWQVVSKKPRALESFTTALNMTGATDGPIFGEKEGEDQNNVPAPQQDSTPGFLDDPRVLDQQTGVDGAPPMPLPIVPAQDMSPEEQAGLPEPVDSVLTPMPDPSQMADGVPVPRAPEETPPPPTYTIDARQDASVPDEPVETSAEDAEAPNKAEDMLKNVMAAREQKKSEDAFGGEGAEPAPEQTAIEDLKEAAPTPAPAPVTPPPEESEIIEARPMPPQEVIKADPLPAEQPIPAAPELPQTAASAGLEQKINTLLEKLARMESRIDEIDAAQDSTIAAVRDELKDEITALKQDTAAPTPKKARSAPAEEPAEQAEAAPKPALAKKKAAAPKPANTGGAWVLKAAKPGKAWVSQAGNPNIQGVVVGDSLPGVGRITAISFHGGRWVVQGTGGRINQ